MNRNLFLTAENFFPFPFFHIHALIFFVPSFRVLEVKGMKMKKIYSCFSLLNKIIERKLKEREINFSFEIIM